MDSGLRKYLGSRFSNVSSGMRKFGSFRIVDLDMCCHSLDGVLVLDKPEGRSSAFVDFLCKKILGAKKIGHIGTLDPFATVVLPLALNAGTKAIPYITPGRKVYDFEVRFGLKTDTADKTGCIVSTSGIIPSAAQIDAVLSRFIGEISQTPPAFSAIKVGGKRAYELARHGKIPAIKPRVVNVFDLRLLASSPEYKLRAEVSPGTYIRTLVEDIASALGTVAHTLSLRRVQDGRFSLSHSISLDALQERRNNLDGVLISLEDVLDDIPVISVSCQDAEDLLFGRCVKVDFSGNYGIYLASAEGGFLEIVDYKKSVTNSGGIINPRKLLRKNWKGE